MTVRCVINRAAPPVAWARGHLDQLIRRRGRRPAIIGLWSVLSFAMAAESQIKWLFPPIDGVIFVHQQIPGWVLSALWTAAGAYALRGAFTRRDEHIVDGFFALAFMPGFYAGSYLWAGLTTPDWRAALYAVVLWLPIALIVYTAATDEHPQPGDPDYVTPVVG